MVKNPACFKEDNTGALKGKRRRRVKNDSWFFLIVQEQYGCKMFVGIRWHASCMFLPCFSHSKEKDVWHLEALRRPDWNFPPCRFSGNKHQSRRQIMSPDQRRATATTTATTTTTTSTSTAAVWSEPGRVSGGNVGGAYAGQVWRGQELHDKLGFECRSSGEDDREEWGFSFWPLCYTFVP